MESKNFDNVSLNVQDAEVIDGSSLGTNQGKLVKTAVEIDDFTSGSMYTNRQLTYTDPQEVGVVYPPTKTPSIMPVDVSGGWAKFFEHNVTSTWGSADIIECCNEVPKVGFSQCTVYSQAVTLASAMEWCFTDQHYSDYAGIDLVSRYRSLVDRALMELLETLIWEGFTKKNVMGILNNPVIPRVSMPEISSSHPTDIIFRIAFLIANTVAITKGAGRPPNTLLLPPSLYSQLSSLTTGINMDKVLLDMLRTVSPYLEFIDWVPALETAGRGGSPVAMAFYNSPDVLKVRLPFDVTGGDLYFNGTHYSRMFYMRFAGVEVFDPASTFIITDIFGNSECGQGGCSNICPTGSFPVYASGDCN